MQSTLKSFFENSDIHLSGFFFVGLFKREKKKEDSFK